ncbi:NAD(P)-dependent dehydrogenase (short-subunit alcohol dehydrogenase family) [Flavobacterium sp. 2755]|uniref:SDR family NAD(P)-dependent oxidoreductase n=1 Tax=Flavobacterium sp. 2755 TaxID=2817765 RepID=UPI002863D1B3|nr:SDR family NAD(P)-dependent oxidoreductase [Flavobacterium sp. 2755]MDR6763683.1 NAD(P)-dependent dehydrogenase (short-subunit alcohol dehydrogenase family) [Flavobacterium sp. 2755]
MMNFASLIYLIILMENTIKSLSISQPIALVTGANKGLGEQVAKELVSNGYLVLIGSRNFDNGKKVAENIGEGAFPIQLDVTDAKSINAAAERIANEFGRLDLLVNNAAIAQSGRYSSVPEILEASKASTASLDEIRILFETNVFGVLAVTQAMLPLIRLSASGRIVNISSALGSLTLNSDPNFPYRSYFGATYPATKTALNALTLAMAIELEKEGIKVRAASPGFTATAINDFMGTDTVEVGARALVLAALDIESPTGSFTGPDGPLPW